MEERGWSQKYFAELLGITTAEVNNIIKGRKNITPRLAVRIATSFGTSVDVRLHLQNGYNLWLLNEDKKERERIQQIKEKLYALSLASFN
ncbi:MAG: HigA family addiction module antidote protein [Candidatus Peribacteria bacterium]|nr:HigA family addiction module antidote protein [Candidatus Peribacteria bacterium]